MTTNIRPTGLRQIEVRPWNVKPGDIVKRYTRAVWPGELPREADAVYETIDHVDKNRGYFSGETYWRLYFTQPTFLGEDYITFYRLNYGMPTRVTVWRV
jgi:hypothetical protein